MKHFFKCAQFFWHLSTLWILHFLCYSMSFILPYLSCIPNPFFAFSPLFSKLPLVCSPIPHFNSYRQPAQFVILKNLFLESSYISSKTNTSVCYDCITLITKLFFTSSMVSSEISPKIIYVIVSQVQNLWYVKYEQTIMSGSSAIYILCQRKAQPAWNYQFFHNMSWFTNIYVTYFAQSRFWWIADCGFNGIKNTSLSIFLFRSTFILTLLHSSMDN